MLFFLNKVLLKRISLKLDVSKYDQIFRRMRIELEFHENVRKKGLLK